MVGVLEVLCGVVAIAAPLILGIFIVRYTVNAPFYDELDWTPMIVDAHNGTLSFGELWAQHNDHRMLFGNLIALGLASLGGWSQVRECLASLSVVIVGQLLLFRLLRATFATRVAFVLLALDSLLLFSLSQENNWTWGFQTVWLLVNTCVVGLLWSLCASPLTTQRFILASAFAVVASYSSLFGLNVWPVGLIALLLSNPRKRLFATAWVTLATLAICLYFYQYQWLWHSPSAAEHAPVWASVVYVFAYLGGPLGNWAGSFWAAAIGSAAVLGYATTSAVTIRSRGTLRQIAAPWIALGAFAILCAVLTTLGRAALGSEQALSSRYATPATTLWISCISLGMLTAALTGSKSFFRFAWAAAAGCAAILFVCSSRYGLKGMRGDYDIHLAAYYAERRIETASDVELLKLYPSADLARHYIEELANIGEGPAAKRPTNGGCSAPCR